MSQKTNQRFHYSQDQAIEKQFNWKQMLRLFSYLKPYQKNLLPKSIFTMLITTCIRLVIPIFIGVLLFDHAIKDRNVTLLMQLIFGIMGLYIVAWISNIFRIRWTNKLGQHIIYDIRKDLFKHIQRLSHRFFDTRSAGSILVRVINDVNSLQELFTSGVINLLMDFILLLGILVIMFILSPQLTLAIMIILPIMFFISTKLRQSIRKSWQLVRIKQSKLNSHLNESIQGIRVTQCYTQENENMGFFEGVNGENYHSWRDATRKSAVFRPFVEMSNAIGTAILIWFGVYLIRNGLDYGVFVTFAFYLGMFWEPISRMGQIYNQLLVAMASSERIFEFLDERPNVCERKDAISLEKIDGKIVFENVEFAYDEKRRALNGIDITINSGETVALVGHTGSGKTTIANLISRFYDPTKGNVKIDGVDLRNVKLDSLRQEVSVVLQETFIFSGTIMENIRFGNPEATNEEVIHASEAVGANIFIERLENQYETEVEERGNVLSVGERQLISFARALLADPKILILDEATASIDTETEVKIQRALNTLLKGRTAIIIAHRLSTIRHSNNIFVLNQGNLIEQGNHEALMTQKGEYYDLIVSQFKMLDAI